MNTPLPNHARIIPLFGVGARSTGKKHAMVIEKVRAILADVLNLGERAVPMNAASKLHGAMPELDSMAVVTIVAALEHQFGITVADAEIGAETFATLGSLSDFVERKLGR